MEWLKKIFSTKKEHVHNWTCSFNAKNAYFHYCEDCPQLSVLTKGTGERTLTEPIITEYDNKGNYNGKLIKRR